MTRRYVGYSENEANTPLDTVGIPVVADDAERDELFPDPEDNQRVQNAADSTIEQWNGSAWTVQFVSSTLQSTALSGVLSQAISAADSAA